MHNPHLFPTEPLLVQYNIAASVLPTLHQHLTSNTHHPTKKRALKISLQGSRKRRRPPTLPHCIAVPSAQTGLTSLFGMGRGGTPPQ